jgi:hypothetical protein
MNNTSFEKIKIHLIQKQVILFLFKKDIDVISLVKYIYDLDDFAFDDSLFFFLSLKIDLM